MPPVELLKHQIEVFLMGIIDTNKLLKVWTLTKLHFLVHAVFLMLAETSPHRHSALLTPFPENYNKSIPTMKINFNTNCTCSLLLRLFPILMIDPKVV